MFSNTIAVTIDGVAKTLVRIKEQDYSSEYYLRETTQDFVLRIRNTTYADKTRGGKSVDRHNVELINTVFPVSPATISVVRKTYIVFENDIGDTVDHVVDLVLGFADFLTEPVLTQLTNRES